MFSIRFGYLQFVGIAIDLWPESLISMHKTTSMGKEAVTVYIIKYILACIRSG